MDTKPKTIDLDALPLKVEYVGQTQRDDWKCFEWRVTFTSKAGFWTLPYYCGLGHVIKAKHSFAQDRPKKPSNADILHSLILDASAANENFADWCSNYGYSDDSITALNTYRECLKTATMLHKHLGRDVVSVLEMQLQDH